MQELTIENEGKRASGQFRLTENREQTHRKAVNRTNSVSEKHSLKNPIFFISLLLTLLSGSLSLFIYIFGELAGALIGLFAGLILFILIYNNWKK